MLMAELDKLSVVALVEALPERDFGAAKSVPSSRTSRPVCTKSSSVTTMAGRMLL